MTRSPNAKSARKPPKQERAKATVQAILDGCIQVLDQEGPEAATTSKIAEVAGVSIGTLYQYFAHREAILDALQDREFERAGTMLADQLKTGAAGEERELAQSVIGGLLALYRDAPGLHRVLAMNALGAKPTDRVQAFDQKIIATLRSFFELTPMKIQRDNRHAAAFVLYQSVRATMLAAILEEPPGLSDEILVKEITDMVLAHLVGTSDS